VVAEGGHTGFSPENLNQVKLLAGLLSKFDRVSNERLLSGPGIQNIYLTLAQMSQTEAQDYSAAEIAEKGVSGEDDLCSNTMDLFFEVLGQVAGDLALTLGSHDGIFIAGGICQRYVEPLQSSRFRQGFANKGRHSSLLEKVPTWLITHPNPGLVGASSFSRLHLSQ
jgi:glucokinase